MDVESEINDRNLQEALTRHDVALLAKTLVERHFVLIHLPDDPADDSNEEITDELGALTAEHHGRDYLVAFTDQDQATTFVQDRADLFESDSEVTGFWVDGATMLDYLDDRLGLLLNPDGQGHLQIEASMIGEIMDELDLE